MRLRNLIGVAGLLLLTGCLPNGCKIGETYIVAPDRDSYRWTDYVKVAKKEGKIPQNYDYKGDPPIDYSYPPPPPSSSAPPAEQPSGEDHSAKPAAAPPPPAHSSSGGDSYSRVSGPEPDNYVERRPRARPAYDDEPDNYVVRRPRDERPRDWRPRDRWYDEPAPRDRLGRHDRRDRGFARDDTHDDRRARHHRRDSHAGRRHHDRSSGCVGDDDDC